MTLDLIVILYICNHLTDTPHMSIQVACVLYLLKQYKQFKYYDEFGIRKQVKRICCTGCIGGIAISIVEDDIPTEF